MMAQKPGGPSWLRQAKFIALAIVVVLVIIVIFQNHETVSFHILFWKTGQAPLLLVLLITLLVGALVGATVALHVFRKKRG